MLNLLARPLCFILIGQLVVLPFAFNAHAKEVELFDPRKVSVAILPLPSSEKDRPFIEETAEAIRSNLKKIPDFSVVDAETAQSLVNYHQDAIRSDGVNLTDAEKNLSLSKTHWFDREYKAAEVTVDRAIDLFRAQRDKGDLLVDALLTKAIVLQEMKRIEESKALFKEVLTVNPALTMEGLPIVGRSRRIFNQTRRDQLERDSGSIEIKSNPPAASIYLNGIKKGVTPLTLSQLPQGSYLLTLEASHYAPFHQPVTVTANTTQYIQRKLQWVSGRSGSGKGSLGVPEKTDTVIQTEIKKAAKIGETLKVDKVILVSSEKRGNDELLVVRTVDTALKAAYNSIGMTFAEIAHDKEIAIKKIAGDLNDQAKLRILNNPAEYLEPDVGDVRILRRKKPFYQTPLFYTLVGIVIGGAVGATTGVLLTRGNGGSDGLDEGGVEVEFE